MSRRDVKRHDEWQTPTHRSKKLREGREVGEGDEQAEHRRLLGH